MHDIDEVDRRILRVMQADGSLSVTDIADRIGFLSEGKIEEEQTASTAGPRFDLNALHDRYTLVAGAPA